MKMEGKARRGRPRLRWKDAVRSKSLGGMGHWQTETERLQDSLPCTDRRRRKVRIESQTSSVKVANERERRDLPWVCCLVLECDRRVCRRCAAWSCSCRVQYYWACPRPPALRSGRDSLRSHSASSRRCHDRPSTWTSTVAAELDSPWVFRRRPPYDSDRSRRRVNVLAPWTRSTGRDSPARATSRVPCWIRATTTLASPAALNCVSATTDATVEVSTPEFRAAGS